MHENTPQPDPMSSTRPLPGDGTVAGTWGEHAGFLRRLATGLVADAASADDTMQDAWLAATRRRDVRPERAWLAGVVRNVAARFRRSEARLKAREQRVARGETLPSTADTVERIEVLRRVVEAVQALEEPYRTVLLLRFFDELGPQEIARRQGIPVETVRTQVRRGLARLRVRLTGAGDDEQQWLAALLPFAELPSLPLPPNSPTFPHTISTSGGVSTGSVLSELLVMSTKTKLAFTLGALALGSLATWRVMQPAPSASDRPVAAITPPPDVGRDVPLMEESPEPAVESVDERRVAAGPSLQAWTLSGQAMRAGATASDLVLNLRAWDGATLDEIEIERAPDHETELTTDATGGFQWFVADTAPNIARVVLVQPGAELAADPNVSWKPARADVPAGAVPEPLVFVLHVLDSALIGTIRDTDGEPIPGATVRLFDDPVTADADGRYRLPLRARGQVYAYAAATGFALQRTLVDDVVVGEERRVDFMLKPEFRVEGVVRDGFGHPVANALIGSFYSHGNETHTDSDGRFALHHLDPGRPQHMVHVKKEGWVMTQVTLPTAPDGLAEHDFTLDRGVRVEGRVVDPAGRPVADASLYIGFSPHAFNRIDAVSAADGTFVFPSVQRGSEKLVVQKQGFGPFQDVITMPEDLDRLGPVDVVLKPGHFVGGVVVDEEDQPLEGVWVSVRYLGEHLDVKGETDVEGYFRIEDLPASDLSLSFYAPRKRLQRVKHSLAAVDADDLAITMPRAGGLAGRVVDGETGAPVTSFRVRFVDPVVAPGEIRLHGYSASWVREGWLFDDADGEWDTESEADLVPGCATGIEVSAPGYAKALAPHVLVVLEPEPADLVLRLFRGVSVTGSVVARATHEAVEGALVKLYRAGENVTLHYSDDTHGRPLVKTDGAGRFRFDDVAPGEHRVLVQSSAYPNRIDGPFEVIAGRPVDRAIELEIGATLTGTLRDAAGDGRGNVGMDLSPGHDTSTTQRTTADSVFGLVQAVTDADGRFRFEGVPAGVYQLGPRIGSDGVVVREYTMSVTLEEAEVLEIDVVPQGSSRLVGRLEYDGGLPALLPLSLVELGDAPYARTYEGIAVEGRFVFTGLPAGRFELSLRFDDFDSGTLWRSARPEEAVLDEGLTSEVWLEVEKSSR